MTIWFNWPHLTGGEWRYLQDAVEKGQLSGDGDYTRRCSQWLEQNLGSVKALLTHSCTAALEMAAILSQVGPGDEVIMPSYTFVSTANAFVLRGAVPVFVDIRADSLNLDERLIADAITNKTKAIVPVHYAGVACEMDAIMALAKQHKLVVIEDAAQGIKSTYRGKLLGTIGDFGALSFHETKNVISGEGGALLVNNPDFVERAQIIREKGTNRTKFLQNQVDKYTWVDIGSSFLPGELIAAFLLAQLEQTDAILAKRAKIWQRYHERLAPLESAGKLRRPSDIDGCPPNYHMYYVLMEDQAKRTKALAKMRELGVQAVFHYVPLHSSPAGQRFGRTYGSLDVTDRISSTLARLPLWIGMEEEHTDQVVGALEQALS